MLTDTAIRKAKPQDKPFKLSDGGGMYLLVKPDGGRYWRMDYRHEDKRKTLAFGVYPTVSLADARQRREDAKRLLARGRDPGAEKKAAKAEKVAAAAVAADTFEKGAREWMAWREKRGETATTTASKDQWRLESYLFPHIGARPITEITPLELRDVLKKVEDAGKQETASRTKITAGQVFRWAVLEGKTHTDITYSLRRLDSHYSPKEAHGQIKH